MISLVSEFGCENLCRLREVTLEVPILYNLVIALSDSFLLKIKIFITNILDNVYAVIIFSSIFMPPMITVEKENERKIVLNPLIRISFLMLCINITHFHFNNIEKLIYI